MIGKNVFLRSEATKNLTLQCHPDDNRDPAISSTRCFAEFTLRIENIEGLSMTARRNYAVID
jgi:hypothetical protein